MGYLGEAPNGSELPKPDSVPSDANATAAPGASTATPVALPATMTADLLKEIIEAHAPQDEQKASLVIPFSLSPVHLSLLHPLYCFLNYCTIKIYPLI